MLFDCIPILVNQRTEHAYQDALESQPGATMLLDPQLCSYTLARHAQRGARSYNGVLHPRADGQIEHLATVAARR